MLKISFGIVLAQFVGSSFLTAQIAVRGTSTGPKSVTIYYYADAITAKNARLIAEVDSEGHFRTTIPAQFPSILEINDTRFLALPRDTVSVEISGLGSKETLKFMGQNARNYSIASELLNRRKFRQILQTTDSAMRYKAQAQIHYSASLNSLTAKNITDPKMLQTIRQILLLQYCDDLLRPIAYGNFKREDLDKDYFKGVDLSVLADQTLLGLRDFIIAVNNFNDNYFSSPSAPGRAYDSLSVADNISSAIVNLNGPVRDAWLLFLFSNLSQQGDTSNTQQMHWLHEQLSTIYNKDKNRLVQVEALMREFEILGKPLPPSVLDQRMMTPAGTSTTLSAALGEGHPIYIDFWASWCGPCIGEMPAQKEIMAKNEGTPVKFVFISFDDQDQRWRTAMEKIDLRGDHFRIEDGFKSTLAKYLSFDGIPRYVIIDKSGRLYDRDAPRPTQILKSGSALFEKLR